MKYALITLGLLFSLSQANAQVTGGERYYEGYSEHWRDEQRSYEPQREKRLDQNELGGPSGSKSDYVYGTRDPYARDDGGRGSNYDRDHYHRRDGY